jgi:cytochrome c peroxidase
VAAQDSGRFLRILLAAFAVAGGGAGMGLAAGRGASASCAERPVGLDAYMPVPEDNRTSDARVALGRALFFDRRLSANGQLACASCHDPARGFTDGRRVAVGVYGRVGTRNVPTLVNRGYGAAHFWDGRALSLEAQALDPIRNPIELGGALDRAVARLAADASSRRAFRAAYGGDVTASDLARALAGYVRTIVAGDAPFDRYLTGDAGALSAEAREGLRLFRGRANCTACHLGPNLTDERFHNTGVAWRNAAFQDEGRAGVTGRAADRGAFKTPTLREVGRTAPYMHDGSLATLDDVVAFYDGGGRPNPNLDAEIRPLRLGAPERTALVAFLRSLSGLVCEGGRPVDGS